jgi:hypothetical protein
MGMRGVGGDSLGGATLGAKLAPVRHHDREAKVRNLTARVARRADHQQVLRLWVEGRGVSQEQPHKPVLVDA